MTTVVSVTFKEWRKLLLLFYFCALITLFWCFSISSNHVVTTSRKEFGNSLNITDIAFFSPPITPHDDRQQQQYYVYGENCKMPYIEPFPPEIKKIYEPLSQQNCTDDDRLIRAIFDTNRQLYLLHIDENIARNLKNFSGDIDCCYKEIIREKDDDDKINVLPCTDFHQDFVVPLHIEGIIVECYSANRTKLLQRDGFAFIQIKSLTNTSTFTNYRKPSVLMIGIDSLSRINFRRTMPKTHQYFKDNNWYEMQGYNKMGDNTFPNLMAVLAGYDQKTAHTNCDVHRLGGIDSCPLIWKTFQGYGYRTAYAEDETEMSTFNYIKRGFKDPPTNHYLRPSLIAFEKHLTVKKRCGLNNCLGIRHTAEYIYDFAAQLINRYNNEPLFGLFWCNSFSHNCYDTTSAMDYMVRDYLKEFEESGALETSVVIFFSDHGRRWGILTDLPDGFFEERLPMLFVWLPKWFSHQYPRYAHALAINRNRLTSPYDLHMTLQHIAELASGGNHKIKPAMNCPQCQSLFHEVPENRTCKEAGIPEHWCTCTPYQVLKTNEKIVNITQLVVDKINAYLSVRNFSSFCRVLSSPTIETVFGEMFLNNDNVGDRGQNGMARKYRIKFQTKPKEALFETTLIYYNDNNTVNVDVESISRLNTYESDSKCVNDKQAKKYCICWNTPTEKKL